MVRGYLHGSAGNFKAGISSGHSILHLMESMKCSLHTHIDYNIHSNDFIYSIAGYFHRYKISWKCCVCIRRHFCSFCFCVRRMLQLIMSSCVTTSLLHTFKKFLRNINLVANVPLTWHSFAGKSSPAMYPCRLDSLSPSPTENDTKMISSICSLYSCKIGQFSVVQQN